MTPFTQSKDPTPFATSRQTAKAPDAGRQQISLDMMLEAEQTAARGIPDITLDWNDPKMRSMYQQAGSAASARAKETGHGYLLDADRQERYRSMMFGSSLPRQTSQITPMQPAHKAAVSQQKNWWAVIERSANLALEVEKVANPMEWMNASASYAGREFVDTVSRTFNKPGERIKNLVMSGRFDTNTELDVYYQHLIAAAKAGPSQLTNMVNRDSPVSGTLALVEGVFSGGAGFFRNSIGSVFRSSARMFAQSARGGAEKLAINASSPSEIAWGYGKLSNRQAQILESLQMPGRSLQLYKSGISPTDLAALTAHTGDEFAVFTLGSRRLVVRGTSKGMRIEDDLKEKLLSQNWKWSAHTHPGFSDNLLMASGFPGDRQALQIFSQERSLILNSVGRRSIFDLENDYLITEQSTYSPSFQRKGY